jgi:Mce-associated membrane protein
MSRPTPRRPSSSRATTPRPRKLAGGSPQSEPQAPLDEPTPGEVPADDHPADEPVSVAKAPTEDPVVDDQAPDDPEPWPDEDPEPVLGEGGPALRSPRVTRLLLVLVGVLALILVLQSLWWLRHDSREEPEASRSAEGAIVVPEDRPVQPTELVVQAGVEAAAKAAQKIVSRTFENYDAEVDAASALLTGSFATEYRQTTDDVREEFIARKTTVQARVVGQGVVRANDTELQALLFIDQYVITSTGKEPKTSRTPYRALLTMVNTDDGWLVEDMQTE